MQAILSLTLPLSQIKSHSSPDSDSSYDETFNAGITFPGTNELEDFVNISVTPVECSVVCSKEAVQRLFVPIINRLQSSSIGDVKIGEDDFVALQVDGEGIDAGKRVLDLTSPLAFAGMYVPKTPLN